MIGEKLTAFFKENGITQEDIAAQIGVSQSYVSALLTGKKAFGKKQAQRFCDIWGLSPSWLLTGHGPMLMNPAPDKKKIPLYDDVATIGGYNDTVANVDTQHQVSEWVDAGDWFPDATAAIHHYGDSMVEYPWRGHLHRVQTPRALKPQDNPGLCPDRRQEERGSRKPHPGVLICFVSNIQGKQLYLCMLTVEDFTPAEGVTLENALRYVVAIQEAAQRDAESVNKDDRSMILGILSAALEDAAHRVSFQRAQLERKGEAKPMSKAQRQQIEMIFCRALEKTEN